MSYDRSALRVLLVEDACDMASVVTKILTKLGFTNIERASDGATALSMLRERKFGLVLADLKMEPVNGLYLLRSIRSDEQLRRTPVVMMTGSSQLEDAVAAKNAGVDSYILKPFTVSGLEAKISEVL